MGSGMIELVSSCGPDFIIGHGQILSGDGDARSEYEIAVLRDSQTTICHLPWVKARHGGVINSIRKYRDMGFRQSLGIVPCHAQLAAS